MSAISRFQMGEAASASTAELNTTADTIRCLLRRPVRCQLQHHRTQGPCSQLHLRQRGRPPDQCRLARLAAAA
eukprot:7878344-Karenia_brevis.AAC.1